MSDNQKMLEVIFGRIVVIERIMHLTMQTRILREENPERVLAMYRSSLDRMIDDLDPQFHDLEAEARRIADRAIRLVEEALHELREETGTQPGTPLRDRS